jgi:ketosteroid isomerase-like protein
VPKSDIAAFRSIASWSNLDWGAAKTTMRADQTRLFDAEATVRDGKPYRNTYTWYFQMRDAKVVKAIAFFDNRDFDEFWNRVFPKP